MQCGNTQTEVVERKEEKEALTASSLTGREGK